MVELCGASDLEEIYTYMSPTVTNQPFYEGYNHGKWNFKLKQTAREQCSSLAERRWRVEAQDRVEAAASGSLKCCVGICTDVCELGRSEILIKK